MTEAGIVIDVSLLCPQAKESGIRSTPSPILRVVRGQFSNQGLELRIEGSLQFVAL